MFCTKLIILNQIMQNIFLHSYIMINIILIVQNQIQHILILYIKSRKLKASEKNLMQIIIKLVEN
jgi:hypothetical protein